MTSTTLTASTMTASHVDGHVPGGVFRFILNHFLVLPIGAAIALVWANTAGESYFRFAQAWAWPVNEIAMAFFLALIAQEVYEAVMPGGALHVWRNWLVPVAGAAGGIAGAGLTYALYVGLVHEAVLLQAWPVAGAIDLAAAYFVLRLVYPRRRNALAFLLVLAVATDAVIITAATVLSPAFEFNPVGGLLMVAMLTVAAILQRMHVRSFWPYWVGCGSLSWLSLYLMGIHPALALVPIVPLLPHDPRPIDLFDDRPDAAPIHHAEHAWNGLAQAALFLFGLVNAGVILQHYDNGTWAVLVAAVAGRPLGVVAGVGLAVLAGLRLPRHMGWRDVWVIALATTSGFTFALFVAALALPIGAVSSQITIGALSTSLGAVLAMAVAWLLGVGRFAARRKAA
ncbi:MAG: Na+/H+ antiporter NhaA [Vicinamibacterales bacterium]